MRSALITEILKRFKKSSIFPIIGDFDSANDDAVQNELDLRVKLNQNVQKNAVLIVSFGSFNTGRERPKFNTKSFRASIYAKKIIICLLNKEHRGMENFKKK